MLHEIPRGSCFQGSKNAVGILVDGNHHELDGGALELEATDYFHTIHSREVNIAENNINIGSISGGGGAGGDVRADAADLDLRAGGAGGGGGGVAGAGGGA